MAIVTTRTLQRVRILAVLADRKRETVLTFLNSIPAHLKETIETVCTDMYLGYVNAVKEALPEAQIVVDRFHVATSKESYAELKGVMWLFRREFKERRPEEKTLLNRLFVYSPDSENAHTLRQQLTEIFVNLIKRKNQRASGFCLGVTAFVVVQSRSLIVS